MIGIMGWRRGWIDVVREGRMMIDILWWGGGRLINMVGWGRGTWFTVQGAGSVNLVFVHSNFHLSFFVLE